MQPTGTSAIYIDEYDLVPALGTVANIEPLATVQVLDSDSLLYVGTVIVPVGHAKPGDKVLTVRSLDPETEINLEVRYGELRVVSPSPPGLQAVGLLPVDLPPTGLPEAGAQSADAEPVAPELETPGLHPAGPRDVSIPSVDSQDVGPPATAWPFEAQEIELELVPARGFDVGRGPGRSVRISYSPGAVGLIVDARGRPLTLDKDPLVRRELAGDWLYRMTGERGT